jgi:hypothetical protein
VHNEFVPVPKLDVAGSNPVSRSSFYSLVISVPVPCPPCYGFFSLGRDVEAVFCESATLECLSYGLCGAGRLEWRHARGMLDIRPSLCQNHAW